MTLKLSDLKKHVQHVLGGTPSEQIGEVNVINQAGRQMFSHAWKFRERPSVELSFNSEETFVTLPGNLGTISSVRMKDGLNDSIELAPFDYVLKIRNGSISTGAHYYAAVVWPDIYDGDGDRQYPRLELAPTPSASDTITLAYRVGWEDLENHDDVAQVPTFAETTLIVYVRAFAQGYEEEGLVQRVAEVEASPIFQRALVQDGMIQPSYGPIRGGMVGRARSEGRLPFNALDTHSHPH